MAEWSGGKLLGADSAPKRLTGLGTLEAATETEISFVAAAKFRSVAEQSKAGLLITPRDWDLPGRARVEVDEVWSAVAEILRRLYPPPKAEPGVHPSAVVGQGVRLGRDVSIGPHCFIGDGAEIGDRARIGPNSSIGAGCSVGPDSVLHPHVTLVGPVEVGARVVLHPGVVLGADGFKFESVAGGIVKIPQVGRVVIEDDVEIGANSAVDRAFLYETRVGAGTKIDNLVQIGHNCTIGRNCLIAGCCALAGSATIEDGCVLGGATAVRDGITIGKGSMVGARATVGKDVPPGSVVGGTPLLPLRDFLKLYSVLPRVPSLLGRVRAIEKKLEENRGDGQGDAR